MSPWPKNEASPEKRIESATRRSRGAQSALLRRGGADHRRSGIRAALSELGDLEGRFRISLRPIRQRSALEASRLRRLGRSRIARRCSASTTRIRKTRWAIFIGVWNLLPNEKSRLWSNPKWTASRCRCFMKEATRYAATRGDGTVGDDITQNVRTISSVPPG